MDSPIRKHINTIHRLPYGLSAHSYHLVIAQNTSAVNSEDIEYTSASTAENQKVSENVYANAPTKPAPSNPIPLAKVSGRINLRPKAVIVQKRNKIVNAEANADIAFTHMATCAVSLAKSEKK